MFNAQLLHAQIPKAQKDTDDLTVHILMLFVSGHVKAWRKHVFEIDPSSQFHQHFTLRMKNFEKSCAKFAQLFSNYSLAL